LDELTDLSKAKVETKGRQVVELSRKLPASDALPWFFQVYLHKFKNSRIKIKAFEISRKKISRCIPSVLDCPSCLREASLFRFCN
jgi:hypothetical protein